MKIVHYQEIESTPVIAEGAKNVNIRWLISKEDGAENFAMRLFELKPGGRTPLHTHEWEHEVFILSGQGVIWNAGNEILLKQGTAIFVPAGEKHCFKNMGDRPMQFICLIPVME